MKTYTLSSLEGILALPVILVGILLLYVVVLAIELLALPVVLLYALVMAPLGKLTLTLK